LRQPTKVKVVGTFHVPFTWNPGKSLTANGNAERACYFCRLMPNKPSNAGSQNIGKNLKNFPGEVDVARCAKFARNLNVFEDISRNNSRKEHPTELDNESCNPLLGAFCLLTFVQGLGSIRDVLVLRRKSGDFSRDGIQVATVRVES
jgi:hypothetical protein